MCSVLTGADILKRRIMYADLARAKKAQTGFEYVKTLARWRDLSSGRFVAEKTVIKLGEGYTRDVVMPQIDRLTERLIAGQIDVPTWQRGMAQSIKNGRSVQHIIGRGGKSSMTQMDYGRLGGRLHNEYTYLNNFAKEIANGKLSPAQIRVRAKLYGSGVRTSYYDGKTAAMADAEYDEERRVLGEAEHCNDCIGYANQGWQPLGSLPEPGNASVCRNNCKCTKEYRKNGKPEKPNIL